MEINQHGNFVDPLAASRAFDRGPWIQTYTGKRYHPQSPSFADVCIEDIAHSLSMQCRYAGHCSEFYSVAEHSVLVSHLVPEQHAFAALMHDATEAYLVDVPRPVKRMLSGYKYLERINWLAICTRFHPLDPDLPPAVHQADTDILLLEKRRLLPFVESFEDWLGHEHKVVYEDFPSGIDITCDPPAVAKAAFLQRFKELTT